MRDSVDIRANVGYLPQDARFYEHMTARQTLDYTAKFFFKGPQIEIDKRVDEMLDLVGLADKADRPIKGFSGGERQRLGIAQAEVNYPDLLILDEPAASLDPQGRRDVLEVMSRIRKYATIFYCTHILDDVQRVSDQVAIVNKGELITQAPIEELLAGTGETVYSVTLRGDAEECLRPGQRAGLGLWDRGQPAGRPDHLGGERDRRGGRRGPAAEPAGVQRFEGVRLWPQGIRSGRCIPEHRGKEREMSTASGNIQFQMVEERGWQPGAGQPAAGRILELVQVIPVVETPHSVARDHQHVHGHLCVCCLTGLCPF